MSSKAAFFALDGGIDKNLKHKPANEMRGVYVNWCSLCNQKEEMLIVFLIHLQLDFLPVIFGVVFSWNVFLAYHSSFKETIHRMGWKIALLCLFWIVWKKREDEPFKTWRFNFGN